MLLKKEMEQYEHISETSLKMSMNETHFSPGWPLLTLRVSCVSRDPVGFLFTSSILSHV